jgi:hypothetical protein
MLKGDFGKDNAEGSDIILGQIEGGGANGAKPARPFGMGM